MWFDICRVFHLVLFGCLERLSDVRGFLMVPLLQRRHFDSNHCGVWTGKAFASAGDPDSDGIEIPYEILKALYVMISSHLSRLSYNSWLGGDTFPCILLNKAYFEELFIFRNFICVSMTSTVVSVV